MSTKSQKDREEVALIITAAMMEAGMSDDQTVAELPGTIRSLRALVISQQEVTCGLRDLDKHDAKVKQAAEKLCELYFNIAAEAIGEDEVRRKRDAALAKLKKAR